jgi:outer membrane lipoprotein-sorting protein
MESTTNQIKLNAIPNEATVPFHNSFHHRGDLSSDGWEWYCQLARNSSTAQIYIRVPLVLILFAAVVAASASAQSASTVPTVQAIVERMGQARAENRARFRPYVVTRSYMLFGKEESKVKSHVIADIAFVPPNLKKFVIEESTGAGLGERAVRRILESEAASAKDYAATDYSPANYDFRYVREEHDINGQRCYVLEMLPKREETNLLRGNIWVDSSTYRIHRFEGAPAKSSSWWVRDVQMVFLYGDVDGMWLQTGTEATARVRILGPHRMVSNDVKYELGSLASAGSSTPNNLKPLPAEILQNSEFKMDPSGLSQRKEPSTWSSTKPYGLR